MSSLPKYIITTITILWLTLNNGFVVEIQSLEIKRTFFNKEVILDYKPIKNNTLIYAVCDVGIYRSDVKCQVTLQTFNTSGIIANKTCDVKVKSEGTDRRIGNQFKLIKLNENSFIFSYSDEPVTREDLIYTEYLMKFRVIHTSDCDKSIETRISLYLLKHHPKPIVYFVLYNETFDVYYDYKILQGTTLWGQTHDIDGKIINGPVPSFLPSNIFFAGSQHVYPAKSRSTIMGHFVISDKVRLVSSKYGALKELVDYQSNVYTFSMPRDDSEYFGFCSMLESYENKVNCTIFDAQGEKISNTIVAFKSKIIGLIAMHNLPDGSYLLLARQCDSNNLDCANTAQEVSHYVVKVYLDGHADDPLEIKEIDCDELRNDQVEFNVMDSGEICVSYVCFSGPNKKRLTFLNLISKCTARLNDKKFHCVLVV